MRLLILILLFPFIAQGQIVRTHSYYKPFAAACTPLLLDTYLGAAAAYSLRKIDCDYAGAAIRVRRSSDNTEQDIGFTSAGDLDTAALKTFVGTGGTDDGFVVTWYDQIGSKNVTQSSSTAQALIMDNGVVQRRGTKPALSFDGGDYYGATDTGLPTGAATYVSVSYCSNSVLGNNEFRAIFTYGVSGTGNTVVDTYGDNGAYLDAILYSQFGDAVSINNRLQIHQLNFGLKPATTGTWNMYVNSTNTASKSMTTNTTLSGDANSFTIGSFNAPFGIVHQMQGNIQEVIIWSGSKSSDRTSIESNINSYYTLW